ncbi:unnamed protein product [Rotaria sordida]|uniref:NHL repeat containing protein n=2 Tax=Rotaria sordida TaxID=392033 RepID=A0A814GZN6_9BILA|nr:unnamed protein product [Rotaria sordida]CAF1095275.1 unnamed protein product [Rotaria sordida]
MAAKQIVTTYVTEPPTTTKTGTSTESTVGSVHKINMPDEQISLTAPVSVVSATSLSNPKGGGARGVFQSPSTYVRNLWTQILASSPMDKLFLLVFVIVSVIGIVLIIALNAALHRSIGTTFTCNLTYTWNTTGTIFVPDTLLESPQGIFIKNNIAYISDAADTPIIYSITTTGTTLTATITSAGLSSPQIVYVDQSNNMFVPDYDHACVFKFTTFGNVPTTPVVAGLIDTPGSNLSQLDGPTQLAFDSTETYMFIADSNNNRIIRFLTTATTGDTGVVVASGTDYGINEPYNLYYDSSSDYLYIANAQSGIVIRWKPFALSGTVVAGVAGSSGSSSSLLYGPGGVYYDAATQLLYVADVGNGRIMAYCNNDASGIMIVGTGIPGNGLTQLGAPYTMAFDSSWNLYVLDSSNSRVQQFIRL